MTQELQPFLDNYALYFIAFCFIWCIGGFGYTWMRMKKNGISFPDKSSVNILFEEKTASGHSHKSAITKLGGGRNCLNVTITDQELWITAMFPFNLIAYYYDGIHKIPLSSIQSATLSGKRLIVVFHRQDGREGKFELCLKKPARFLEILNKNR